MQAGVDDNSIFLVRATPGSHAARQALQRATAASRESSGETIVFFHGAGVEHAGSPYSGDWHPLGRQFGAGLEVCSAAWRRRRDEAVAPPFALSTLIRFWHRAATGFRVVCNGEDDGDPTMHDGSWLIRIDSAPTERDSLERLEMVLAGASLELPLVVVFAGPGRGHLTGEPGRHWRQVVDFDLARLCFQGKDGFSPNIPAVAIDERELAELCRRNRGVIRL